MKVCGLIIRLNGIPGMFLAILLSLTSFAPLFSQKNYFEGRIKVDEQRSFNFPNAGKKILIEPSTNMHDSISCLLKVNGDSSDVLEFGSARIEGNTLILNFLNHDSSFGDHACSVKIKRNQFKVSYDYFYVLDEIPSKRVIHLIDSKLVINSSNVMDEKVISGYIEIEGFCNDGCSNKSGQKNFIISGNFKFVIVK